jgi:soluble lytic murein transglycosylase-like protein
MIAIKHIGDGGGMRIVFEILLIFVLGMTPAFADVYRYVDESGTTHFSDHPKEAAYRKVFSDPEPAAPVQSVMATEIVSTKKPEPTPKGGASRPARSKKRDALDQMIETEARNHGMEPALVKAVVHAESSFDARAVSSAGAMGLMQLMPKTGKEFGLKDPFNPRENVRVGTRYLRNLLNIFNNDLPLALAAYNAGMNKVMKYGGIPPYRETERYVKKVLKFYETYAQKGWTPIFKVTSPSGDVVYTNRSDYALPPPAPRSLQF